MQLEEYINLELKYPFLKLKKAEFNTSNSVLDLLFIYPQSYDISAQEEEQIKNNIQEFINKKEVSIFVRFKKMLVDESQIKLVIKDYFEKNHPSILNLVKLDELKVQRNDSVYFVSFMLNKSISSALNIEQVKSAITKELSDYFLVNFDLQIETNSEENLSLENVLKENDNFSMELEILRQRNKPQFQTYEFFQATAFIGEIMEKQAVRTDCFDDYEKDEFIVAGTLNNVNKITYTPKTVKEGETPQEKIRVTFFVKDYWGQTQCVYFPTQKAMEVLDDIVDGMVVAVKGEKNYFNGKTSFRVRAIATIVMPDKPEETVEERKPFPNYLVTKLMPYVEEKQMDLLTMNQTQNYSDYIMNNDFVVYDFETTGLVAETCDVIEIGAVKIHNGQITELFSTLIHSPEPLPEVIVNVTNITDEMLKDAPPFELAFADFYKFCQGCILAGYNNLEFDTKFLKKEWKRIGFNHTFDEVDVFVKAKQKLRLNNYKLGTVVKALGIELVDAHRAYADATATAKAFLKLF